MLWFQSLARWYFVTGYDYANFTSGIVVYIFQTKLMATALVPTSVPMILVLVTV